MDYKSAHAFSTAIFIFRESDCLKIHWWPLQSTCTDKSFSTVCCTFHRSEHLLRYVKKGYPSNWCHHCHPWHWKIWLRVFIQRAWHLWLCLEHWFCHCLQKVQSWIFLVEVDCCLMFFTPLSMIIDYLMLLLSLSSKEVIKGIHAMSMTFVALS